MRTQYLCLPLIKTGGTAGGSTPTTTTTSSSATNSRVPPATSSLLERFRVAVFRLIMVTALSKTANHSSSSSSRSSSNATPDRNSRNQSLRRSSYYLNDPYPSEALADCIEFIKKSSASSSPFGHQKVDHDHDHDHDLDLDLDEDDNKVESPRDSAVSSDMVTLVPVKCT